MQRRTNQPVVFRRELRLAVIAAVVLTIVFGLAYPLAMTGVAQVVFPGKADGSPELIARDYSDDPSLFQSRPSVTGYARDATFFNNQGPNQKALADQLRGYVDEYLKRELPYTPGLRAADIPPDAVTTSASGVDPQISEANARIQANRVAKERDMPLERVLALVDDASSKPLLGLGGPASVNVNDLNQALEVR
jgi:potassium-transporting ATPase KdpC subunit